MKILTALGNIAGLVNRLLPSRKKKAYDEFKRLEVALDQALARSDRMRVMRIRKRMSELRQEYNLNL